MSYLRGELSRRRRQFAVIGLGLAAGIALVVTVGAASTGVRNAQGRVLHALFGIGTDLSVTKPPPPPSGGTRGLQTSGAGSGSFNFGGQSFNFGSKPRSVDLLGLAPDLGVLDARSARAISRLPGVAASAGGLDLEDVKLTLPSRSQEQAGTVPLRSGVSSSTVDGVDVAKLGVGPLSSATLVAGRTFAAADSSSDVALVDSGYAATHHLRVGSSIAIAGRPFRVIGLVRQAQGGGAAAVYIPLARAQALARYGGARLTGKVNVIYVRAASAGAISNVQREISRLLPSAAVTTSATLASAVSGSLASAASLANDLGRWLAIATLIATFTLASLLTLAAVARRVRELGTLKALGWRTRRIVAQVVAELAVVGAIAAIIGIAGGFGGAALVAAAAPPLSATVAQSPGSTAPPVFSVNSAGVQRHAAPGATHTVALHLSAPVTPATIALAVLLALAGALIAGASGGWRAGRLHPAVALRQVA